MKETQFSEKIDKTTTPVDSEDLLRVYRIMGSLIDFFHQPLNYSSSDEVVEFLKNGVYQEMSQVYYDILWKYLPEEEKKRIEEM